jgi:KipI family sensor histidine kinase inhibitor
MEYGDVIDPVVNQKVRSISIVAKQDMPPGVIEIIPAYRSIMIIYDPSVTKPQKLQDAFISLEKRLTGIDITSPKTIEIPVCYGGKLGPDIQVVAESNNISVTDVIRLHSQPEYIIYMIGFAPGFPFLGGLPETLHTPRLKTPRTSVPQGSVGIANKQTGIYPAESPGGWQLIGRTPLKLFDPARSNPILYRAGDRIRFISISEDEYNHLLKKETSQ